MTTEVLFELRLTEESDVFTARQLGRECAVALGMDRLDDPGRHRDQRAGQDVVATGGSRARFQVESANELCIDVLGTRTPPDGRRVSQPRSGRRGHAHGAAGDDGVTLCKRFGVSVDRSVDRLQQVRTRLAALSSQNPTDELKRAEP